MNAPSLRGERRLYTRIKKRIPVSIHYNEHCIARCFTNNISIGGALIEVEDIGLTENALVEIIFSVSPWHAMHNVRIPAIVVWRNETQIAISFEMLNKDTEELMQDHIDSVLVYHDDVDKNNFLDPSHQTVFNLLSINSRCSVDRPNCFATMILILRPL